MQSKAHVTVIWYHLHRFCFELHCLGVFGSSLYRFLQKIAYWAVISVYKELNLMEKREISWKTDKRGRESRQGWGVMGLERCTVPSSGGGQKFIIKIFDNWAHYEHWISFECWSTHYVNTNLLTCSHTQPVKEVLNVVCQRPTSKQVHKKCVCFAQSVFNRQLPPGVLPLIFDSAVLINDP